MGGLIVLGIIIVAIVVFDIIALTKGADSRPGFATGPLNGFRTN
jgi:hypothetical protein